MPRAHWHPPLIAISSINAAISAYSTATKRDDSMGRVEARDGMKHQAWRLEKLKKKRNGERNLATAWQGRHGIGRRIKQHQPCLLTTPAKAGGSEANLNDAPWRGARAANNAVNDNGIARISIS